MIVPSYVVQCGDKGGGVGGLQTMVADLQMTESKGVKNYRVPMGSTLPVSGLYRSCIKTT